MITKTVSQQLHIRHATREDIPFIAWCNYEASSPAPDFCYWDPLLAELNTETMAFIEAVFRAEALAWGNAEDFLIIEENGKPVAGASGFEMGNQDYRPLRLDRLPAVAKSLGWTGQMLEQFRQGYGAVWIDPLDTTLAPSAPWIIECMAVVPQSRGQGIAKHLMQALLEEGRQQGFTQAGISVTIGNEAARRVYEGVGFQMYVTYGAEYFDHAFPGTIKYRMKIA